MSELALKLIREAKKTKAKTLDLGKCGLTELPDELFDLVWLEELYLGNSGWIYNFETKKEVLFKSQNKGEANNIKNLSPKFQQLQNLKRLLANGSYGAKWELEDLNSLISLKNLQHVDVSNTQVSDLQALKNLANLQYANISLTQVSELQALKNLAKLERLDVSFTQVSELQSLKNLENLRYLSATETQVSDLSPLKKLINLEILGLGGSQIEKIDFFKYCINLKEVYIWSTQIEDLSPLQKLENLQLLQIGKTKVTDLSPLKNLDKLQDLSIHNTKITDLSPLKDLGNLRKVIAFQTQVSDLIPLKNLIKKGLQVNWEEHHIKGITVKDCPLTNPPIEIAKQGNEAILNYWKQIETQGGTQTINEAKLIIVGEGGTGKTTLFNKLVDPTFDLLKTPTKETKGINIHEGLEIKEGFLANLWDFGGQELQYMTHQFFLTPNSVYVLMMEARKEAPNLAYWFKIISLLGKDKSGAKVSLIIVLNKRKGSTGMPQYQDLLKIYEDDFDYQFIELDLAVNDKRWGSLREAIEQRLVDLPIVKNKLPKKWNPIRDALREVAQKDPYINAARLRELCQPFQVEKEADQFLMTEYLHQLGSLLHFQGEEDNLIDLIVLSPEWVVEGVYTVLKDDRIREKQKGKFTEKDMTQILCANQYKIGDKDKEYTKVDAKKLIQLMSRNNFDICYQSKSGKYVAAQLLPDNRPTNYKWNKNFNAALQFRYQYPIMPKGLMSRLIVRLSDNLEIIDGQEIVWKKGAILSMEINGSTCRVLMREEDGETRTGLRQIVIEVLEEKLPCNNRKYALHEVRKEIESLHRRWFKNITSEQIVPCNCDKCRDSDDPHTYELSRLLKLTKPHIYCLNKEELVPLRQLLEGVYKPEEIQSFAQNEGRRRPEY